MRCLVVRVICVFPICRLRLKCALSFFFGWDWLFCKLGAAHESGGKDLHSWSGAVPGSSMVPLHDNCWEVGIYKWRSRLFYSNATHKGTFIPWNVLWPHEWRLCVTGNYARARNLDEPLKCRSETDCVTLCTRAGPILHNTDRGRLPRISRCWLICTLSG